MYYGQLKTGKHIIIHGLATCNGCQFRQWKTFSGSVQKAGELHQKILISQVVDCQCTSLSHSNACRFTSSIEGQLQFLALTLLHYLRTLHVVYVPIDFPYIAICNLIMRKNIYPKISDQNQLPNGIIITQSLITLYCVKCFLEVYKLLI